MSETEAEADVEEADHAAAEADPDEVVALYVRVSTED